MRHLRSHHCLQGTITYRLNPFITLQLSIQDLSFQISAQVGGGRSQDDTVLSCARGSDSALIFHANSRLANLTVRAELGSCLLHKGGRLTIENCALQCLAHPLEHLSCPLVSTADAPLASVGGPSSEVSVAKTRIEGGQRAVQCSGTLALQQVRVMAMKATLLFWFTVAARQLESISAPAS